MIELDSFIKRFLSIILNKRNQIVINMINTKIIFLSALIVVFSSIFHSTLAETKNVFCYYESYKIEEYEPEEIDVNICTHVLYASLTINENGTLTLDGDDSQIKRLVALKSINPEFKILLSIDGWSDEVNDTFSVVAADPARKQVLAEDSLNYLQTYDLDGVDIDWHYPAQRAGHADDRENFVDLLSVLRDSFNSASATNNKNYVITLAVSSKPDNKSYDVEAIASIVDSINIMTYDFHGFEEGRTGQNSPLYYSSGDSNYAKEFLNCDAAVTNWLGAGAPPEKLAMGLPFYGHGFQLADPEVNGVNVPSVGEGTYHRYTNYYEICVLVDGWTEVWDDEQKVPYKYGGTDWLGYDNVQSIGLKVQYAKSKKLGGVMVWALDYDDTKELCGSKNPLLNAIKDNL